MCLWDVGGVILAFGVCLREVGGEVSVCGVCLWEVGDVVLACVSLGGGWCGHGVMCASVGGR